MRLIALIEESGWYDSCGSDQIQRIGERLVELGAWEKDIERGIGRRQWYRPKKEAGR